MLVGNAHPTAAIRLKLDPRFLEEVGDVVRQDGLN